MKHRIVIRHTGNPADGATLRCTCKTVQHLDTLPTADELMVITLVHGPRNAGFSFELFDPNPPATKSRRKIKSPLAGVSRDNMVMLRTFAVAASRFRKNAEAGHYRDLPYAWSLMEASAGLAAARVLDEFEVRAIRRMQERPDWYDIQEQRRVERMRKFDTHAYEVHQLRQELNRTNDNVSDIGRTVAELTGAAA